MNKIPQNRIELFRSGDEARAFEWLGVQREDTSLIFRVWAPSAESVFLVGAFNDWLETCPLTRLEGGVWEVSLSSDSVKTGDLYKYKISFEGKKYFRSDPYAVKLDEPPLCASVITEGDYYKWRDRGWMAQRSETALAGFYSQPINIYELHAGSWMKRGDRFLTYRELAEELTPYVKQMGYTHVELMPLASHPYFGSWGYQTGGYFAPDSRYGDSTDLMSFVDTMHRAGVGVILDWTPAHFPKDEFSLYEFDGSHLYEYESEERRETCEWDTARFDLTRGEVVSFLISNAIYWIEKYHIDGIRADAVSSMLYLDYGKAEGEWTPAPDGSNICYEAVEFFKKLNRTVKSLHPDVMMIAEESGDFGGVTSSDGLGFDLKWNMGWMNDTLRYATAEFRDRGSVHDRLTFPLTYAFGEKYLLPISHDEVTHGKRSFLDKMPGDYWQKFAGARAFEALRMFSPGKKLSFMGSEIAQFREWSHEREVEWFLLDYESHDRHQLYIADLNVFYLAHPELWRVDNGWEGFKWIEPDDAERSIISFRRIAENGNELIIAINLTPRTYPDYFLPVPEDGIYEEIFNSDSIRYGGSGVTNEGVRFSSRPNPEPLDGRAAESILPYAVRLRLPPLGATVLKIVERRFSDSEEEKSGEATEKPRRRGIRKLNPPRRKMFL